VKANDNLVLHTVEEGIGGRMPKGLVQGEQAKEVARFVAENLAYVGQTTTTSASP
jgi:hypothetical protein